MACCNLISSKLRREEVPGASLQQNAKLMLAPAGDEIW